MIGLLQSGTGRGTIWLIAPRGSLPPRGRLATTGDFEARTRLEALGGRVAPGARLAGLRGAGTVDALLRPRDATLRAGTSRLTVRPVRVTRRVRLTGDASLELAAAGRAGVDGDG